jgi:hypothetical protein
MTLPIQILFWYLMLSAVIATVTLLMVFNRRKFHGTREQMDARDHLLTHWMLLFILWPWFIFGKD